MVSFYSHCWRFSWSTLDHQGRWSIALSCTLAPGLLRLWRIPTRVYQRPLIPFIISFQTTYIASMKPKVSCNFHLEYPESFYKLLNRCYSPNCPPLLCPAGLPRISGSRSSWRSQTRAGYGRYFWCLRNRHSPRRCGGTSEGGWPFFQRHSAASFRIWMSVASCWRASSPSRLAFYLSYLSGLHNCHPYAGCTPTASKPSQKVLDTQKYRTDLQDTSRCPARTTLAPYPSWNASTSCEIPGGPRCRTSSSIHGTHLCSSTVGGCGRTASDDPGLSWSWRGRKSFHRSTFWRYTFQRWVALLLGCGLWRVGSGPRNSNRIGSRRIRTGRP